MNFLGNYGDGGGSCLRIDQTKIKQGLSQLSSLQQIDRWTERLREMLIDRWMDGYKDRFKEQERDIDRWIKKITSKKM